MIGKKSPNKITAQSSKFMVQRLKFLIFNCIFALCALYFAFSCYAQTGAGEPVTINGDTVEYSTENKEATASGNVEVLYKGARLTCQKLTVNMQTKDAVAEGAVRLEDELGVMEGSRVIYNFEKKTGIVIDSEFRSNPYFGRSEQIDKVSDAEFIALRGYMSTCNYDNPHYRMKSKKIDFFPNDLVKTKGNSLYIGRVPVAYLPQYTHSLKDPLMHVQLAPGKRKEWGPYLLSAWRYNITENVKGRVYFDYREQLGVAEGFGLNYKTADFGKGDYKFYYTQERSRRFKENEPAEFQRYFIRWRHNWDIDKQTNLTSEYFKIADSKRALHGSEYNVLKEYFFREYEKDSAPLSYSLLHRNFNNSSMDFMVQKRVNRWYSQLEKLPEVKYSLPSYQISSSPFYFEDSSQAANYNYKYAVPSASENDISMLRFDTNNKISLPTRIAFISLMPSISNRQTYYDEDAYGSSSLLRTVFYTGLDASTKFYRTFNVSSGFLGMDINGLRHIITPTAAYSYNHDPTILSSRLKQIDSLDSIAKSNAASLELSNKLQTKRKGQSVDFVNLVAKSAYTFYTDTTSKSSFSDFLFDLELIPYAWMRLDADTTYNHRADYFSAANFDANFDLGNERTVGLGHRYQRKGGKEFSFNTNWKLSPKWKFRIYERYQFAQTSGLIKGLKEQEYAISRDLHCWIMDVTYNVKREEGEAIWLIFRLKAFPEMEFGFDQSYHQPKSGSQGY